MSLSDGSGKRRKPQPRPAVTLSPRPPGLHARSRRCLSRKRLRLRPPSLSRQTNRACPRKRTAPVPRECGACPRISQCLSRESTGSCPAGARCLSRDRRRCLSSQNHHACPVTRPAAAPWAGGACPAAERSACPGDCSAFGRRCGPMSRPAAIPALQSACPRTGCGACPRKITCACPFQEETHRNSEVKPPEPGPSNGQLR